MTKRTREAVRSPWARVTGALYLAYFATTIITTIVQSRVSDTVVKTGSLLAFVLYAIVTLLFYDLFKPVDSRLTLLAALVSLAGCVFGSLDVFHVPTRHVNALIFFGPYCVLLGILILGSKFLPHVLGTLMALAGLGWLLFLVPAVARHLGIGIEILGVAAEGLLMLWLLIKGVNVQKWQKQARAGTRD
jgi:hypothetical protein